MQEAVFFAKFIIGIENLNQENIAITFDTDSHYYL